MGAVDAGQEPPSVVTAPEFTTSERPTIHRAVERTAHMQKSDPRESLIKAEWVRKLSEDVLSVSAHTPAGLNSERRAMKR